MLGAFGENNSGQEEDTGAPPSFDYRAGDTATAVWGWQFRADSARAPEFLDIRHASVDGLRLTGSGAASVTTPPFFRPGEIVSVAGGGPSVPDPLLERGINVVLDCTARMTIPGHHRQDIESVDMSGLIVHLVDGFRNSHRVNVRAGERLDPSSVRAVP